MTIKDIIDALSSQYGALALLVLIGIAGASGKWVWGWMYDAKMEECRRWEALALRLLGAAHHTLDLLEDEVKSK